MSGYTKLFGTILGSTIWLEDNPTRILWITMLAAADKCGMVKASVPGLAHIARITPEEARQGLDILMAPDPDSRTKEHEGRRIQALDGGWLLLNYEKYRNLMSAEERREYKRAWMQNRRSAESTESTCGQCGHIAEAEAEAEASTPPVPPKGGCGGKSKFDPLEAEIPENLQHPAFLEAWVNWCKHRSEIRNRLTPLAVKKQLTALGAIGPDRAIAAINHSIANGWHGIFEAKKVMDTGNQKPAQTKSAWEIKATIEAIESELSDLEHESYVDALGRQWADDGAKKKWFELKRRVKALTAELAGR